jgi:hypothetical protein
LTTSVGGGGNDFFWLFIGEESGEPRMRLFDAPQYAAYHGDEFVGLERLG